MTEHVMAALAGCFWVASRATDSAAAATGIAIGASLAVKVSSLALVVPLGVVLLIVARRRTVLHAARLGAVVISVGVAKIPPVRFDPERLPVAVRNHAELSITQSSLLSLSDAELEEVLVEVENYIEANCESEVESRYVGEIVMEQLRVLDQVAYVRFASVYRSFEDISEFRDAIESLEAEPKGDNAG